MGERRKWLMYLSKTTLWKTDHNKHTGSHWSVNVCFPPVLHLQNQVNLNPPWMLNHATQMLNVEIYCLHLLPLPLLSPKSSVLDWKLLRARTTLHVLCKVSSYTLIALYRYLYLNRQGVAIIQTPQNPHNGSSWGCNWGFCNPKGKIYLRGEKSSKNILSIVCACCRWWGAGSSLGCHSDG